jgi:cell division protein FtsB
LELIEMHHWEAALRLSIVFAVALFVTLAASVYEIDRREKSTSDTVAANFADLDQRVQALSAQIRILHDQYTSQLAADERWLQALNSQIEALRNQYDARVKELEGASRVGR